MPARFVPRRFAGEGVVLGGGGLVVLVSYVYPPLRFADWLSGLVTLTTATPAVCAGVVATSCVVELKVTETAAVPPNVTFAPETKCEPVIVTTVPPALVPCVGEMLVTIGAG